MKNNLTKSKVWQIIGVAVLCAVCVLTAVLGVVFGMNHSSEDLNVSKDMSNQDPLIIETVEAKNISLMSGVSTTAADGTTSKALTATVKPSNADSTLFWTIAFDNNNSTWAKGKVVSDYVDFAVSENTLSCTITCLKAFGERIILTVTSAVKDSCFAKCNLDYEKRILDFNITMKEKTAGVVSAVNFSDDKLTYSFESSYSFSDGTITPSPTVTYKFTDEFVSAIKASSDLVSFTADSTVHSLSSGLVFDAPYANKNSSVGYGQYILSQSYLQMFNRNPQQAGPYFAAVRAEVEKALQNYSGNVLMFQCSYTSSNGNGASCSLTKYISKGTCNFKSLIVSSVSLSSDSIVF